MVWELPVNVLKGLVWFLIIMPLRDVISSTSMTSYYVNYGLSREALRAFLE